MSRRSRSLRSVSLSLGTLTSPLLIAALARAAGTDGSAPRAAAAATVVSAAAAATAGIVSAAGGLEDGVHSDLEPAEVHDVGRDAAADQQDDEDEGDDLARAA